VGALLLLVVVVVLFVVCRLSQMDLVRKLVKHVQVAEGSYRDQLIEKIIYMCSRDKYAFLVRNVHDLHDLQVQPPSSCRRSRARTSLAMEGEKEGGREGGK
jgi:hypothetical protein